MSYTLAAAAAACGLNKSTVLRAIKAGKTSGTKDDQAKSLFNSSLKASLPARLAAAVVSK